MDEEEIGEDIKDGNISSAEGGSTDQERRVVEKRRKEKRRKEKRRESI